MSEGGGSGAPSLAALLEEGRPDLCRFLERQGANLLRFESVEDLVQGIHLRAIGAAERFVYRGEEEFRGWLARLARTHLASRHRYWRAMQRDAGAMLRISQAHSRSRGAPGSVDPSASEAGPATVAGRRESLALAMKAFEALFPKDRDLVRWIADDLSIEEIAERMGVSYDAAKQARLRAISRFRKAYEATARRGLSGGGVAGTGPG